MDSNLSARLDAIEKRINEVYVSAEKTRKYIMWTAIITIAVIVLPLLLLPFAVGQLMSYYGDISSLGL